MIDALSETNHRAARAQAAFLETNRTALQELSAMLSPQDATAVGPAPMFSRTDLEEFASGSIARCFGPEYQVFEGRRYPRIPNGALLLMDRVISIAGRRHDLTKGSSIVTEYDVSPTAWLYQSGYAQLPPYVVLMEMALQPCGLLSAYLGSAFPLKEVELYFRNLDGFAQVLASPDLRGKTVTGRAELLSSTLSGTTIIQKYRFSLSTGAQVFYAGESVFGYFSAAGMANQVGLDGGQLLANPLFTGQNLPPDTRRIHLDRSPSAPLQLLDEILFLPDGGKPGLGQIAARQKIDPDDWFYKCHFYQDPVMPGSLGVEAALQAMLVFSQEPGRVNPYTPPVLSFPIGKRFDWKYRGQVLPTQGEMSLLGEIISREPAPGGETLTANVSIWVDRTRIYALNGLAITVSHPK
ncbi:MAG TPA: hypothetical protein VGJ97_04155 [Anaerolineaceae bacterium]